MESLPVKFFQRHVVCQVYAEIGLCGNSPTSMLELLFMDVDGNVGADKVFKTASMVEMEMAKEDGLDVFDVVASGPDGGGKLVFFVVDDAGKNISQRGTPFLLESVHVIIDQYLAEITALDWYGGRCSIQLPHSQRSRFQRGSGRPGDVRLGRTR